MKEPRVLTVRWLTILATSFLVANLAHAQDSDELERSGFYVGAGILGTSYRQLDDKISKRLEFLGSNRNVEVDVALGFDTYVGYRLNPYLAIETEFEMLPESKFDTDSDGKVAEIETWALTVGARAILPLGWFQPYLHAGVGLIEVEMKGLGVADNLLEESNREVAGRFGGGAEIVLTKSVVVRTHLDYVLPGGDLSDYDYLSFGAGIQYRF